MNQQKTLLSIDREITEKELEYRRLFFHSGVADILESELIEPSDYAISLLAELTELHKLRKNMIKSLSDANLQPVSRLTIFRKICELRWLQITSYLKISSHTKQISQIMQNELERELNAMLKKINSPSS